MRYVIVCLLKGNVLKFHEKLVEGVCFKYDVKRQRLPAHFTLKAPFETENIKDVEKTLERFTNTKQKEPITIDGFGHFDTRVIFMDVKLSNEAIIIYDELISELKNIPWMTWRKNDGESGINKSFHCTIVSKLNDKKFEPIWEHVSKYNPEFSTYFDNISILKWDENKRKWVNHKEYKLK